MSEKSPLPESKPAAAETPATPTPPRRSPGHRGQDVRDTVAEMAARAHEISLEAGSKMAAAMKDVINAAAGLTGFAVESARDLVQYMVRRGQMTQDEADKLMREVEASHAKRKPFTPPASAAKASPKVEAPHAPERHAPAPVKHVAHTSHATHSSHASHATHTSHLSHAAKPAAKHAAAKKPVAKKTTMKPASKKRATKPATKSKPKASGKTAKRR